MRRFWKRPRIAAALTLTLLLGASGAFVAFRSVPVAAAPVALLTVFTGSATIVHAGVSRPGSTGDALGDGDGVGTSIDGRAAVTFPDGSQMRLDVSSGVRAIHLAAANGGLEVRIEQSAGSTFNSVAALLGTSSYQVRGPNGSTAEVRGTDFMVTVGIDDAGQAADEVDVLNGEVEVRSAGARELVAGGQATHATSTKPPERSRPIAETVKRSPFVVFNQAVSAATGTRPVASTVETLNQGESAAPRKVSGGSDLTFTLSWPGSTFRLTVVDPNGAVYRQVESPASPIVVVVPRAATGDWTYAVTDLQSSPKEAYATVVGRGRPSPPPAPPAFEPAACDASGRPGESVAIDVRATSPTGAVPLITLDGTPPGVTLSPDGDSDGVVVRVAIPRHRPPAEIDFRVVAVAGGVRASLLCKVEVRRAMPRPAPSVWSSPPPLSRPPAPVRSPAPPPATQPRISHGPQSPAGRPAPRDSIQASSPRPAASQSPR